MEAIIKFIDDLVIYGKVNGLFLTIAIGLVSSAVASYYIGRLVMYIQNHFAKKESEAYKEITEVLQKDHSYLLSLLDDIKDRLKTIETKGEQGLALGKELENEIEKLSDEMDNLKVDQTDSTKAVNNLEKDISILVTDSKEQYAEITRQVQSLQKDLAALHGTIIGLNTQRSKLK